MKTELEEKKSAQLQKLMELLPSNDEKQLMDIPGLYYGGGCSYMACRGLMMGPIKDVLLITHGPTGCGYFAGINGNKETCAPVQTSHDGRVFSTNMQETDIIFGGEKRLMDAIGEAVERYHPKVIAVCATCPVGLIGDDIDQVAREAEERYGVPILPLSCEGFKTNQNGGWLLGGMKIARNWLGTGDRECGPFSVHYMSEAYEGRNRLVIQDLFSRIGYEIVGAMMGSTTYEELCSCHRARLTVLDSGKKIDPVPEYISQTYGTGFFRVDFTGIARIVDSLNRMAEFFQDEGITRRTREVIDQELARIEPQWMEYRQKFQGKTAALFEDVFRSDHFASLCTDLGMEVVMVSEDYSHRDLSDENFTLHLSEKRLADMTGLGEPDERREGRAYFHMNRSQVRALLEQLAPDICFKGIEEQFGYGEAPIRSEQFTSEERGVEYGGFDGFLRFAEDLSMAAFQSHWITQRPAWAEEGDGDHGE